MTTPVAAGDGSPQLTLEEAARLDHYCETCRTIHFDRRPTVRTCPRCQGRGYDCCIPAPQALCARCVHDDDLKASRW